MRHYIAVLVPDDEVGWRAHFPDLPGCRTEARHIENVVAQASKAATEMVGGLLGGGPPLPRTLEDIRGDEEWAAERSIDWTKALISVVPLAIQED